MADLLALLSWAQIVVLAASLPLAVLAAWGFRSAPVGRSVVALPLISAGFLAAATAQLLGPPTDGITLWQVGSAVAGLAFAWFAVTFLRLVSGRRRIGS